MGQPGSWNFIELDCCRCKASVVISRDKLDEYDRSGRVFLCHDCKGEA